MIPWDIGVVALMAFFDGMGGSNPQWGYVKEACIEALYEGMRAYAENAAYTLRADWVYQDLGLPRTWEKRINA